MSTFTKLAYHIIFSTKLRRPLIRGDFQQRLYSYIGGILRAQKGDLLKIGGIEDHIHILTYLQATTAISEAIQSIKGCSSKWCNEHCNLTEKFEWQKGYAAFTVSHSLIESVNNYIAHQEEHHRKKTFAEEYMAFLTLHQIPFELKWLFEGEYHG